MSKDMCFVLNQKLKDIKDLYERALGRLQVANHTLQGQIDTY